MKTTLEGLTHLINMLADVVNLQRKAQGTPGASCDVQVLFEESGRVTVELCAVVDAAVPAYGSEEVRADKPLATPLELQGT